MNQKGVLIRAALAGTFVLLLFSALSIRVVHLQLGKHEALRESYKRRVVYRQELQGNRGRILDRNGHTLAQDEGRKHVAIDPEFIHRHGKPVELQEALTRFLRVEPALIGTRLADTERRFHYLEKFVDQRRADQMMGYLKENALQRGVVLQEVNSRSYPHGNLLSHVVGFANREGAGSLGIEQEMNRYLRGKGGLRVGEKDGRRRELVTRRRVQIDPEDGADVTLTVDQYLQHGVEEALEEGIREYNALGGWAVVMDVKTGAILAMASKPDFDPNRFFEFEQERMRNRNLRMIYEPGSIMKPLVFGAALNEGLVDPKEMIDCEHGVWIHRRRPLRDYHPYAELSAEDVLKKSSNIGTAKIALRMSPEKLYTYFEEFGFGQRTGIELPGEEAGISHPPSRWDSLTHSRVSIGHSISVTALQMAAAMNVIANDGRKVNPFMIQEVRSPHGTVLYKQEQGPEGAQVFRPEVAQEMRRLMSRIVGPGGTGRRAAVEGYTVAGKTGTAEKIMSDGTYSERANIASFAGFLPAENPALTIVVSIDEPRGEKRTGGSVAAPVFRRIAEHAVACLTIPPGGFE